MAFAETFDSIDALLEDLSSLYEDLHQHPELSFQEVRTAEILAKRIEALGYDTTTGVGLTGVVGVLENGEGPTVLLRADIDALPVAEDTGLPYASTVVARDEEGQEVGVAHACGHDMHATWMIGAATWLVEHRHLWSGKVLIVFQPAEEFGAGAKRMVDDGLFERFGTPEVCLGQHLAPAPAGWVLLRAGPAMAASDAVKITLHGRGGHGSSPQMTVDPAIMAASTIMKLQTVVSREVAPIEEAVVTVGTVRIGTKENIISDRAELKVNVRTFSDYVRDKVLASIDRIAHGEAHSCGAPKDPEVEHLYHFPVLSNSEAETATVFSRFQSHFGFENTMEAPKATGSEDFGYFAESAGCPQVFWFTGGHDKERWIEAFNSGRLEEEVPFNHSPRFAPSQHPTIRTGIEALLVAAESWIGR